MQLERISMSLLGDVIFPSIHRSPTNFKLPLPNFADPERFTDTLHQDPIMQADEQFAGGSGQHGTLDKFAEQLRKGQTQEPVSVRKYCADSVQIGEGLFSLNGYTDLCRKHL